MGACLSKQRVVAPVDKVAQLAGGAADETLAESGNAVNSASYTSQQPTTKDDLPSGPADYTGAIAPVCELQRRQHLLNFNILYTAPEQRFDDIMQLCSTVFKVPIALVSLVDEKVQWFKAAVGLPGVDRTPRPTSFCAWTLLPAHPEALVVEDAQHDARFKRNPLVTGQPHIRFYAGCPLVCSNGMRLGSLCIIDKEPRVFDAESCNMLANLAELVVRDIEKDKALQEQWLRQKQQDDHKQQLLRAIDCYDEAIMLVDTSSERWGIVFASKACEQLMGKEHQAGQGFWNVFQLPAPDSDSPANHRQDCNDAIANQCNFEIMVTFHDLRDVLRDCSSTRIWQPGQQQYESPDNSRELMVPVHYATAQFRCAGTTGLDHMAPIGIPNFLPSTAEGNRSFYFVTLRDVHVQPSGASCSSTASCPAVSPQQQQKQLFLPRAASFSLMDSDEPFGGIRLGPLLGTGAFGRVYRGNWNGKMVAVKVIEHVQEDNHDGCLEGLLSEQLVHPHIVQTYKHTTRPLRVGLPGGFAEEEEEEEDKLMLGSCSTDGLPRARAQRMLETWLVLEFCNKGCLSGAVGKGWFRQKGSLQADMPTVLATAREVAGALAYLHSRDILHGDLTGHNVLLTDNPGDKRGFMAKVSDFGLSRSVSNKAPVIETQTYGTVTHMPAELLMEGNVSKAADTYSFGVVLWEMYTGKPPYLGMWHSQVLHCVSTGRGLTLPQDTPAMFANLVASCLSTSPEDRPTFPQIIQQLDAMRMAQACMQVDLQA